MYKVNAICQPLLMNERYRGQGHLWLGLRLEKGQRMSCVLQCIDHAELMARAKYIGLWQRSCLIDHVPL